MKGTAAEQNSETLCRTVVEAIATHTDADPLSMTPLGTLVDPEALEAVVSSATNVHVTFDYEGHTVDVRGDRRVSVDGQEYGDALATGGD